jgi:hypothetical protein
VRISRAGALAVLPAKVAVEKIKIPAIRKRILVMFIAFMVCVF